MHVPKTSKPTLAVVIAFCDSTPDDPMPHPHVIAQKSPETGQHELWNARIHPDMTTLDIYEQFAEAYLLDPHKMEKFNFLPLARVETATHKLRVLAVSRLFRWQEFIRLDDKELLKVTEARKSPQWNDMTQVAVEAAYRSAGLRFILEHARMIRKGRLYALPDKLPSLSTFY